MEAEISFAYGVFSQQAPDLYANGFAIAAIEFRVGGEGASMEEIISDCMDAARYLSFYSDVLGIDAQNIITAGHSAGASASLLLGHAPHTRFDAGQYWSDAEDFHVSGVFALSPGTILYAGEDGPRGGYYSNGAKNNVSLWYNDEIRQLCSPINYVSADGVPCKILMGDMDELVAPISVEKYKAACDAVGMECEVVWFKNAGHGFDLRVEGATVTPNYDTIRSTITDFAKSCVEQ